MGHLSWLLASAAKMAECGRPTCLEKGGPFFVQVAHFQGFWQYRKRENHSQHYHSGLSWSFLPGLASIFLWKLLVQRGGIVSTDSFYYICFSDLTADTTYIPIFSFKILLITQFWILKLKTILTIAVLHTSSIFNIHNSSHILGIVA